MRAKIIATFLALSAPLALAQEASERPEDPAPAASAMIEERQTWCEDYASWYVSRMPEQRNPPADAREGHLLQVELQYCVLDPQRYQQQTLAELQRLTETG